MYRIILLFINDKEAYMFDREDFDNINYIKFDDDFNIELDKSSKIIFGYNGIGKSSMVKK